MTTTTNSLYGGNAGRRVLVTGGGSGMGRATVERLLGDGARVAGWDVHLEGRGQDEALRWWNCDVSDEDAVRAAMAETGDWLGGIDAVVHFPGIILASEVPVDQLDLADWEKVLAVNLTGAFLVTKHAAQHLERTSGALVLIGSGAGVFNAHRSTPYAVSKGGLHGLTITLEGSLRRRGIRLIDVAVGSVDTPLMRAESPAERVDEGVASGRILPASAIANLMAFLVSDYATAVRGPIRTW